MHQQDTIASFQGHGGLDTVTHRPARPQTPYQVLRLLPKDATPAQQDSAIQAYFQPAEIRYSDRPDTLHLPGHDAGHSMIDPTLPEYYRENFFSANSPYYTEAAIDSRGVAGTPAPYTLRDDNTITLLLLVSLMVTIVSISRFGDYIKHQFRRMLYLSHHSTASVKTFSEMRFLGFLGLLTCLQVSIESFFYTTSFVADTFVFDSLYLLLALFFGVGVAYFLVKLLLYYLVNAVFFGSGKKCLQWTESYLVLVSLEGLLLFPVVLVQVYFGLSMQIVLYYCAFVLILTKILTFYTAWAIFFRQKGVSLQIILYFCALEVAPLLALVGGMVSVVNELKINI